MKMLIVENDAIVTKIWKRFFEREFDVSTVYQAPEALALIEKEGCPDIVLLDLRLNGPKSTGMLVYNYIRYELKSLIPILFVTGLESGIDLYIQAFQAEQVDSRKSIPTKLIQKPVRINKLRQAIRESLTMEAPSLLPNHTMS